MTTTRCVITHKSAVLIYFEVEALNHAYNSSVFHGHSAIVKNIPPGLESQKSLQGL
jgi:hypothetical protein